MRSLDRSPHRPAPSGWFFPSSANASAELVAFELRLKGPVGWGGARAGSGRWQRVPTEGDSSPAPQAFPLQSWEGAEGGLPSPLPGPSHHPGCCCPGKPSLICPVCEGAFKPGGTRRAPLPARRARPHPALQPSPLGAPRLQQRPRGPWQTGMPRQQSPDPGFLPEEQYPAVPCLDSVHESPSGCLSLASPTRPAVEARPTASSARCAPSRATA